MCFFVAPLASLSLLLLSPFVSISATAKESPRFDAYYTTISIKDENKRLDNYAFQLQHAPQSRGLIVVYAKNERTAKSAKARARRAFNYLVKTRGVSPARIVWRYEAVCGHDEIILYLLYANETDPERDPKCLRA